MAVSISQYQSQLPVIWFLISIMGNFFIGRERLLPNVAWLGHFSLGLDMTRHAVLLGNSVAQGGMSWIGRIPCFVFCWLVQNTNQLSWAIKLWNDMTNYWATSFVYMDYCPFFSIVMPRLTFWKNCCPTWHGLVRYWATWFPHVGIVDLGWPHECINANSCLVPDRSVSWHFFIFQIFNFFGMAFG